MTLISASPTCGRLQAPTQHGTALIVPPLHSAARLLKNNQELLRAYDYDLQGRNLRQLIQDARRGLVRQARQYTLAYRDVDDQQDEGTWTPILLAGHQPELFHSGVWFKNFALDHLGKQLQARTIHLLIDNDTARYVAIRVPTGSVVNPRIESVPLDRAGADVAYEERTIVDRELLTSFHRRVAQSIAPLVHQPLIGDLWRPVQEICRQTDNVGQCVAQARHRFEGRLGLNTLELPLSQVCTTESFRWFVAHLLAHLPRFWEIHNSSLREYRQTNRVRSRTHPVPELVTDQEWLEAPFWLWTRDDQHRRRLFVWLRDGEIELTNQGSVRRKLALCADGDADRCVEQLAALEQAGIKLRPRALITTMYARLILGDLFLHGIGGAKYDELTDWIVRGFFQLEPPAFLTISATMLLPIERSAIRPEDLRNIERQLRELVYHPERYLDQRCQADRETASLMAQKRRWVQTQPPSGQRHHRHLEICRINDALQRCVQGHRRELLERRAAITSELRHHALLASRDFSFCLFPEGTLLPLLLELLSEGP